MSGRDNTPRGAGGRRRYVPDWPQHIGETRQRMGRVMLLLGLLIFVSAFGVSRLRDHGNTGDVTPAITLVRAASGWRLASAAAPVAVQVERVIDGDTLDVRAQQTPLRVRLYGIDAPETGQRCAPEAAARLAALAGAAVALLPDARLQDTFGRELRYVATPDGRSIDAALVDEGLARAWTEDGALRDRLVEIERDARAAHRGCLWSSGG